MKYQKKWKWILFILLLVCIIGYLYQIQNKNKIREDYLTYFWPGYDESKNSLYQFYDQKEYNYLNMKKEFIYQPLRFAFIENLQNMTSKYIITILLSNSRIQRIQGIGYPHFKNVIEDLTQNKIQFALLPFPIISYFTFYKDHTTKQFTSINYILSMYRRYVFIMTKRKSGIRNLTNMGVDLVNRKKIRVGVLEDGIVKGSVIANDVLSSLQYKENVDFEYFEYKTNLSLLVAFQMDDVDLIFYNGYNQDNLLNQFITSMISDEIYILPFDIPNRDVFSQSKFQYYLSNYDLNLSSPNYLPKRFDGKTWSRFKPNISLLAYDEYLVTNPKVPDQIVYETIKTCYDSIDLLNSYPELRGNPISKVGIGRDTNMPILYHNGSYAFYKERGFITYESNPNCRYLVGRMECTEKTLKDNNLWLEGPVGEAPIIH
jgi:TRAP-type uncharacterized transport system substrate-binding protein